MPDGADHERRRGAPRRRVLRSAQIVYRDGRIAIDCTVRNVSDTGAQLATESPYELPPSFWLHFGDGIKRPVELVWTRGSLMGVRFVDTHQTEVKPALFEVERSAKAGIMNKINEIERQLMELRAEIAIKMRD